ncbi:MAG: NUDIX domain-containing protein [Halioglobus sp.]|nr:NUDIX domain-containing protein [Halioglobus sp.]
MPQLNFCPECAGPLLPHRVGGELRAHRYCARCQVPVHDHPLVVVTSFIACGKRLLWVQRDLDPQRGKWAIPGGFLECGETLAQGAARELREEACVDLQPERLRLYMAGTITFINQIYMGFRATVDSEDCATGPESMASRFFARDECPWDEVAYPQVNDSILQAYDDLDTGRFDIWEAEMTSEHYSLRQVLQDSR